MYTDIYEHTQHKMKLFSEISSHNLILKNTNLNVNNISREKNLI